MDKWMRDAWDFQQEMYRHLGNRKWDELYFNTSLLLKKLDIAFELCFGQNYSSNDKIKEFTEKVESRIKKIFYKYGKNVACTFLNYRTKNGSEGKFFVFFFQYDLSERCVDLYGRNYMSWADFLENNKLPKCSIMYPKSGRYYHENEDFVDVVFEESIACSPKRVEKENVDKCARIGGILATGMLAFNPVSTLLLLGAGAVSVATGIHTIRNCLDQIKDIDEHQGGLSLDDPETILVLSEAALTLFSTVATGTSAGIRGITAKSAAGLSKVSIASRLAMNVGSGMTKICSSFNVILRVQNNQKGQFSSGDLIRLSNILFFSGSAVVAENLVLKVIEELSVTENKSFYLNMSSTSSVFNSVNKIRYYSSEKDLPDLMKTIIPGYEEVVEKISDFSVLTKRITCVVNRTTKMINRNKFSIDDILYLLNNFRSLKKEFIEYKNKENKVIKKIVTETIRMCSRNIDSQVLRKREQHLFSELLNLMQLHFLKDSHFFVGKVSFYCQVFQESYKSIMANCHYSYFKFTLESDEIKNTSISSVFNSVCNISDIHEYVYFKSINDLKDNIEFYHKKFEDNYQGDTKVGKRKDSFIHNFQIPLVHSPFVKDKLYEVAKESMPWLMINELLTTFHDCGSLAIIKSVENDFVIYFSTTIQDNCIEGILLFAGDISMPPFNPNRSATSKNITNSAFWSFVLILFIFLNVFPIAGYGFNEIIENNTKIFDCGLIPCIKMYPHLQF